MHCTRVVSVRSQCFHHRRFFSNQAKLLSTIQGFGMPLTGCSAVRLASCPVTCLPRMSRPPLLNGAPTDALLHPTQCTRPNPTVPCFSGEQEAVAVSHRCWRHSHRMPEALRVNGDMALYSRPLFRCVIPLVTGCVAIFDALGIDDQQRAARVAPLSRSYHAKLIF